MENKDKLKEKINNAIGIAIDKISEMGDLDYFEIEIKNHKGDLQSKVITKNREKVY